MCRMSHRAAEPPGVCGDLIAEEPDRGGRGSLDGGDWFAEIVKHGPGLRPVEDRHPLHSQATLVSSRRKWPEANDCSTSARIDEERRGADQKQRSEQVTRRAHCTK